jgi:S-adenosylmethionine:tRNA ribosyltransferase-isomerase
LQYHLSDFDYECPSHLIAQHPASARDDSRLMVVHGADIEHRTFRDLAGLIRKGDLLVINTSRVIPARLVGVRENGRAAEVLLVRAEPDGTWLAMVHPGGKLKKGRTVSFGADARVTVEDVLGGGLRRVSLSGTVDWRELMDSFGNVPLPPYITRAPETDDDERYQTVYAREDGSIAAPTAGLHFTLETLSGIRTVGAAVAEIVLHVGPGTFKPVQTENLHDHRMHSEWFSLPLATAVALERTRKAGGRVWAVGTTVARVLETVGCETDPTERSGWTDLFIRPAYQFRAVDCLITNFHLPGSTLLMLACAFGGYENVMHAYREAVSANYRFYSYGDAMLIL